MDVVHIFFCRNAVSQSLYNSDGSEPDVRLNYLKTLISLRWGVNTPE